MGKKLQLKYVSTVNKNLRVYFPILNVRPKFSLNLVDKNQSLEFNIHLY